MDNEEYARPKRKEHYEEEGGETFIFMGYKYPFSATNTVTDLLVCGSRGGRGGAMMAIIFIIGPIPTRWGGRIE